MTKINSGTGSGGGIITPLAFWQYDHTIRVICQTLQNDSAHECPHIFVFFLRIMNLYLCGLCAFFENTCDVCVWFSSIWMCVSKTPSILLLGLVKMVKEPSQSIQTQVLKHIDSHYESEFCNLHWIKTAGYAHSTRPVAIPVLKWEWRRGSLETVECSNHFWNTQQFLSNAKLTLQYCNSNISVLAHLNAYR